jgi:hypothetical protein
MPFNGFKMPYHLDSVLKNGSIKPGVRRVSLGRRTVFSQKVLASSNMQFNFVRQAD